MQDKLATEEAGEREVPPDPLELPVNLVQLVQLEDLVLQAQVVQEVNKESEVL